MPNLMDLPAELHIEIAKSLLSELFHSRTCLLANPRTRNVRSLRCASSYWTEIVDYVADQENAAQWRIVEQARQDNGYGSFVNSAFFTYGRAVCVIDRLKTGNDCGGPTAEMWDRIAALECTGIEERIIRLLLG